MSSSFRGDDLSNYWQKLKPDGDFLFLTSYFWVVTSFKINPVCGSSCVCVHAYVRLYCVGDLYCLGKSVKIDIQTRTHAGTDGRTLRCTDGQTDTVFISYFLVPSSCFFKNQSWVRFFVCVRASVFVLVSFHCIGKSNHRQTVRETDR